MSSSLSNLLARHLFIAHEVTNHHLRNRSIVISALNEQDAINSAKTVHGLVAPIISKVEDPSKTAKQMREERAAFTRAFADSN